MRIAFFHNWSWLGSSLARALLALGKDELWIIGAPTPQAERDPDLVELARRARVLAVAPRDVGSPRFIGRLRTFAPDLIVVGTFARKLPPELLAVPRLAAINVHASLLPKYRGALPEFWVIRDGELESGLSIHHMTERFDEGNVLAQARFPLGADETLLSISRRLSEAGPPLLVEVLERYRAGERPAGEPQDPGRASRAPAVREEHLRIRWDEPSVSIERLIRAAFPVFDAHFDARGHRVVVRRLKVRGPSLPGPGAPGAVLLDPTSRRFVVGTKTGAVEVLGVELDGETLSGAALFERLGLRDGERLS